MFNCKSAIAPCLLASTLALLTGCAQIDVSDSIPWVGGEDKPGVPVKVVAVWTDTVLRHSDRPAERGFGGRLMFYGEEDNESIKIDGSLVVYAFDEDGRRPEDAKPDRKFVFTAEQLEKHYSESRLGHSYSVWIPWDNLGGVQKEISLIVRFTPSEGGGVVIGEQAKQILPGSKPGAGLVETESATPAGQLSPQADQSAVQRASYQEEIYEPASAEPATDSPKKARMTTHTISVSPRFGAHELPSAAMRPRPAARPSFFGQAPADQPSPGNAQTQAPPTQQRPVPPQEARFFSVRPRMPGQSLSRVIRGGPWQQQPTTSDNPQ